MIRMARATQYLYYPEFLPDAGRPAGLPGASLDDRPEGVSESFGTLRYGRLVEMLLYDCRRHLTLKGPHAAFVPETVEAWLLRRMRESPARHVVNVPSTPIGWSAGKWGEWYPDLLGEDGKLSTARPKYFWQEGWRRQHDRLVAACSAMNRIPLFISGDLHALAHGRILRNGAADLRRNPVVTVLRGLFPRARAGGRRRRGELPRAFPPAWRSRKGWPRWRTTGSPSPTSLRTASSSRCSGGRSGSRSPCWTRCSRSIVLR